MPYDLFISYSRLDNENGRVTQLVERIKADFASFAGRPLNVFFDKHAIQGCARALLHASSARTAFANDFQTFHVWLPSAAAPRRADAVH